MSPSYDFRCDTCGHVEEITCSMDDIVGKRVWCPKCIEVTHISAGPQGFAPGLKGRLMHRLYGSSGFMLKGDGWPSKQFRREGEDKTIQRQRRKACVLKDRGEVPESAVINPKEADALFDKRHPEGKLNELYKESIEGD